MLHRHYHVYMYTELAPKLTATASVAQSVNRWSRDPARDLGVAFFATGPGWVNVYLPYTRIYPTLNKSIYIP